MARLQRQLQEAYEHERQLREERRQIIHQVAVSPVKTVAKKTSSESPLAVKKLEEEIPCDDAQHAAESIIPAYRPEHEQDDAPDDLCPQESQDTFGRIVDASVARNMELVAKRDENDDVMESPAFFTSKRKAMHCEMDEPGFDIPYPKNNQKKGILQRFLSCFHKPSVYSPPRVTSPRQRPSSAGLVPPTLTLESQVAPLRMSLTQVVREDPMYEAVAPVYEVKHEEVAPLPVARQDSFESLVAEVSDAENTPEMVSKISPRRVTDEVKRTAVAVSDLVSNQNPSRQYHVIHNGRKTSEINSAPCSPEKAKHRHDAAPVSAPSSRAPSPPRSSVSMTKPRGGSSPFKAPSYQPRMTKAALARNEATRKKIERQKKKEQAHMNAMPAEIRRQSRSKQHADSRLSTADSDAILSMMRPEELEAHEQISKQSIDAFLPKLNKSLECLQDDWDSSKIAGVQSAAMQVVHKSFSDQNHIQSLSFSEDPFYRELAKIDHSLTPQDLDVLRAALLKSEDFNS